MALQRIYQPYLHKEGPYVDRVGIFAVNVGLMGLFEFVQSYKPGETKDLPMALQ